MKKLLLLLAAAFGYSASAQVICYVQQPPALVGNYDHSWASGWGLTPDMTDPANAVEDTVVFGYDTTPADSLGCDSLLNGDEIYGQIAIVYRGSCNFSLKALHAQYAGARAIIIINNVPGAPIAMGAGTYGAYVTIPVFMITADDGALLRPEIELKHVTMFLGSIAGFFPNNVSIYQGDVVLPIASGRNDLSCATAAEGQMQLGAWVHNYGSGDQIGVILNGKVMQGATTLYDQNSTPVDILATDSAFVTLPDFSTSPYAGVYTLTYTAGDLVTDSFPGDNSVSADFSVIDDYSLGTIDASSGRVNPSQYYIPSGMALDAQFMSCIHFRDANASRMAATGIYIANSHVAGDSLTEQFVQVKALQWDDAFTGLSDAGIGVTATIELATGDYIYSADLTDSVIFVPFDDAFVMDDNQRYLFCELSFNNRIYHPFSTANYARHVEVYDQPISVISDAGTWYVQGFGLDVTSALGVQMIPQEFVGVEELNGTTSANAYPNPAATFVQIPVNGFAGEATVEVTDASGRVVSTQQVTASDASLMVDVSTIANGSYLFNLRNASGANTSFRVVVNK